MTRRAGGTDGRERHWSAERGRSTPSRPGSSRFGIARLGSSVTRDRERHSLRGAGAGRETSGRETSRFESIERLFGTGARSIVSVDRESREREDPRQSFVGASRRGVRASTPFSSPRITVRGSIRLREPPEKDRSGELPLGAGWPWPRCEIASRGAAAESRPRISIVRD
jgi:hypothetical protein